MEDFNITMEKLRLTAHIRDIELKNKMYKVIDKANSCLKNYDIKTTEFLNPFEVKNAIDILNSEQDLKYKVDGGYINAERRLIYIFPYYIEEEDIQNNLRVIQIEGNFKFKSISHRDYLGALLNLGIKREKIGDIIIHDDFCQVIVSEDICDFIIINLEKVSRNKVKVKEITVKDIVESKQSFKEISFTVSSLRIDSIISGIYNLSRNESLKLIKGEKINVDYEKIISASREIKSNSLISVRGYGRAIVEIGDFTKKGRIKVRAKIIL